EYYTLIMQMSGKLAAAGRSGKMGSREFVQENFGVLPDVSKPELWGVVLDGPSGGMPQGTMPKLKIGIQFFSKTAAVLFPEYAKTEAYIEKFTRTMMTFVAYTKEIDYWKHLDADYIALTHANLNVDNAYFWRDDQGQLDCGVLDWGGFGAACPLEGCLLDIGWL
ncbi:CPK2, partial [Symbiodinium microadriaticum]